MKNDALGWTAAVLVGAAIGAGVALLYSPQPGARTRRQLYKQAQDLKHWTDDFLRGVKEQDERICCAMRNAAEDYRREMLDKLK